MTEKSGNPGPTNEEQFNDIIAAARGDKSNGSIENHAVLVGGLRRHTLWQKAIRLAT
jgi:hypothetical protein